MTGEDPTRRQAGSVTRVSGDELALRLGVDRHRVDELAASSAIVRGADGSFDPGDIHRVRLLLAFEAGAMVFDG